MSDPWAERIPLNPDITPTNGITLGLPPPSPTGTLAGNDDGEAWGMPDKSQAATVASDALDGTKTMDAPDNPTLSWGGIVNPYKTNVPGTQN